MVCLPDSLLAIFRYGCGKTLCDNTGEAMKILILDEYFFDGNRDCQKFLRQNSFDEAKILGEDFSIGKAWAQKENPGILV